MANRRKLESYIPDIPDTWNADFAPGQWTAVNDWKEANKKVATAAAAGMKTHTITPIEPRTELEQTLFNTDQLEFYIHKTTKDIWASLPEKGWFNLKEKKYYRTVEYDKFKKLGNAGHMLTQILKGIQRKY